MIVFIQKEERQITTIAITQIYPNILWMPVPFLETSWMAPTTKAKRANIRWRKIIGLASEKRAEFIWELY